MIGPWFQAGSESDEMSRIHFPVIYFWPGRRVELACAFCKHERIIDGKPKLWRVLSLNDAFASTVVGKDPQAHLNRREKWVGLLLCCIKARNLTI